MENQHQQNNNKRHRDKDGERREEEEEEQREKRKIVPGRDVERYLGQPCTSSWLSTVAVLG